MRKRHQTGGIKKQRGRWIGMWWVDGARKSKVLGFVKDLSKTEARDAIRQLVEEEKAKRETRDMKFTKANRALCDHVSRGEDVHLFEEIPVFLFS